MSERRRFWTLITGACALVFGHVPAQAADISGVISTTLTIFDDSRLIGDVQCVVLNAPCISLGAPGIKLELNGFTITGPADPPNNCASTNDIPADGISAVGQNAIVIDGPGLVQKFRRRGISLVTVSKATVRRVASRDNCSTGFMLRFATESLVEDVVSVRNGIAFGLDTDGGLRLSNATSNRVRHSAFYGNGSTVFGQPTDPQANDFGVGLVGDSSGNIIEENAIGGNVNGVQLAVTAVGNVIVRN